MAFNPDGFVWVSAAGMAKSTLYDGNGVVQTLVVATIPRPTGIVYNGINTDFVVTQNGVSGGSAFIFVGEGGQLAGWSPAVNRTATVTAYDGSALGASYKGLAIASQGGVQFLYATDFRNGRIDVFDRAFAQQSAIGCFVDPGLAMAGFGTLGGMLLVGNFGDGRINAFNPTTGEHLGALGRGDGTPIAIEGLWGIAFGNGLNAQPATTLFFAAGPAGETHGQYGRLDIQP